MCKCTEKPTFKKKLKEALKKTKEKGVQYVVYGYDKISEPFVNPEEHAKKMNICCYYIPNEDGTYIKVDTDIDIPKIDITQDEVVEEPLENAFLETNEVVEEKPKRKKKSKEDDI